MPPIRGSETRPTLTIGRLCTPTMRKWPANLVPFYRRLAEACPEVSWEFVGCPPGLQSSLREACHNRATFWAAGWTARSRLTSWDALLYHHPDLDETFGRTVAEGMRVGCLPIVDRRGGFIEQLEQGGGWLCDGERDFARAIEQLRQPELRTDQQRQAREIAERHWSLDAFARRLLAWMDRVCLNKNAHPRPGVGFMRTSSS